MAGRHTQQRDFQYRGNAMVLQTPHYTTVLAAGTRIPRRPERAQERQALPPNMYS